MGETMRGESAFGSSGEEDLEVCEFDRDIGTLLFVDCGCG
jgi:hypothetical protein